MVDDDATPRPPSSEVPTPSEGLRPAVTLVPLGRDPTQPIRLVRPPSTAPEEWKGDDRTVVAPKPSVAEPTADGWKGADPTVLGHTTSQDWKGDDATVIGQPSLAIPAEEWKGDDRTVIGAVPAKSADVEAEWIGNDATQIGVAPGAPAVRKEGGTTTGSQGTSGSRTTGSKTGSKATSPTLDDAWHFKGRQGPLTGKLIGDYQCGGILGEGGMGTVYRARQVSLKRRVALKVLPPNLAADLHLRARFEQEAATASLLNSPHVVQVFAAGTITDEVQGDIVYFVMEYVEGTDLAGIIAEKRDKGESFTPEEAAGYIIQAARGLAEAGKHNIVHRDIKPANLMVTAKGVVKIADFGISKVAGEHGMTMTGTTVGTPAYCSPEQGRGDQVDPRADLYSLGVAFYELLAGRKPFDGTTANALIYQHNYQEPKLLTEVRPGLSEAYQAVCLKCLMKDPASRYQDAAELVADLERVRDGNMSVTAVFQAKFGTGADEAMKKYLGHTPWYQKPVNIAAGVILIGILAGGGWYIDQTSRDERAAKASTVQERKEGLARLDTAHPIQPNYEGDLVFVRDNTVDDPDVPRWAAKLERVKATKRLLSPLLTGPLPDARTRAQTAAPLAELTKDVSDQDVEVAAALARLAEADRVRSALRVELSTGVAEGVALTRARVTELRPRLEEYTRLAGADDTDAPVWSARLGEFDARLAALGASLAVLDDGKAVVGERTARTLRNELVRYSAAAGSDDAQTVRWDAALDKAEARVVALRKAVTDQVTAELGMAGQEQAGRLLADYRALVDASDATLLSAETRLTAARARLETVKAQLVAGLAAERHDQTESELKDLEGALTAWVALARADDPSTPVWRNRLRQETDSLVADRAALQKFATGPATGLTRGGREAYAKALSALAARGALAGDADAGHRARIRESEDYEKSLRTELNALRGNREAITDNEVNENKLDELERIAGRQDEEVAYWRGFLSDYKRLKDALEPLDQLAPLPAKAEETLAALAALVSPSNQKVARWKAKIARVRDLQTALTGTELAQPLPAKARINVADLVAEVGLGDRQAKTWHEKIERVHTLRDLLTSILGSDPTSVLPTNYVLPGGHAARAAAEELAALVSDRENDVRWWRYRVAILKGPGRPAWATAYERDDFGPWAEVTLEGLKAPVRFRYVPAGTFTLGSPESEAERDEDETPVPGVTLTKSFWMADAEVTQDLWMRVTRSANPARFSRFADSLERPVERISWSEADEFTRQFTERLKAERQVTVRARLPTEAEWEYAAKAGSEAPWNIFTGPVTEDALAEAGWYGLSDGTRGVRRRQPNRLGLFDLHGNVWEWCEDRYWTYSAARAVDPVGAQEDTRIARGGSWADPASRCRAANRIALRPDMRTLYVGMRLVIDVEWTEPPVRPGTED